MKLTEKEIQAFKKAYKAAKLCGMGFAFKESLSQADDIEPEDYKAIIGESLPQKGD